MSSKVTTGLRTRCAMPPGPGCARQPVPGSGGLIYEHPLASFEPLQRGLAHPLVGVSRQPGQRVGRRPRLPAPGEGRTDMRAVSIIARRELRDTLHSYWLLGFGALFALLTF